MGNTHLFVSSLNAFCENSRETLSVVKKICALFDWKLAIELCVSHCESAPRIEAMPTRNCSSLR